MLNRFCFKNLRVSSLSSNIFSNFIKTSSKSFAKKDDKKARMSDSEATRGAKASGSASDQERKAATEQTITVNTTPTETTQTQSQSTTTTTPTQSTQNSSGVKQIHTVDGHKVSIFQ